jgi:hypothetical protein
MLQLLFRVWQNPCVIQYRQYNTCLAHLCVIQHGQHNTCLFLSVCRSVPAHNTCLSILLQDCGMMYQPRSCNNITNTNLNAKLTANLSVNQVFALALSQWQPITLLLHNGPLAERFGIAQAIRAYGDALKFRTRGRKLPVISVRRFSWTYGS